ncbi:unnamed protein product [Periconia digitata]|uniref:Protein kinase domain-containing protein n=1 Tax=Periconia digitata TaxID=1303443 RepID=A0A9W4URY3_9PLEO|nr:unnamed protein product [Periconia digitata]
MAPYSGSSHTFQKLKLDTGAQKPTTTSTFASIPRSDPPQSQHASAPASSQLTSDLADCSLRTRSHGIPIKRPGHQPSHHHHHHAPYDSRSVVIGSSSEDDDLEIQFTQRPKAISFSKEVTLDSGNRLSLEDPLPKPEFKPRSRPESDGDDYSDQDYLEMHQRNRAQHHIPESRYPLLQSTVDDLNEAKELDDRVASLTSATTASPTEVRTPLEAPAEYTLSPLPSTSSPIEFPIFPGKRFGSQRSRSYREFGENDGSRRASRRSSAARSGRSLSSMSPAASFLSRYKTSDAPLKPPEPDEEGQGVGYHGEYIIGKQIGYGGFSVVKEVTSIEDGKRVVNAVKIVRRQLQYKSELENEEIQTHFDHEVEIWRFLRHPYILPLLCVYTTDFATYCITRLNEGGTLFDEVRTLRRSQKTGLPQALAKRYTYQLASAMRYLHNDVQIVHRDIKLENCLVDKSGPTAEEEGGNVLLCDFGMADFIVSDQRDGPDPHSIGENQNIGPGGTSTSIAGSLEYAAPELFTVSGSVFSPAADVWAFGVVVYALLTAKLPFSEGLESKTSMKIRSGEYDVEIIRSSEAVQGGGVEDAIALVQGCLDMDVEKRWTIHDILECRWLQGCMQQYEHVPREWLAES